MAIGKKIFRETFLRFRLIDFSDCDDGTDEQPHCCCMEKNTILLEIFYSLIFLSVDLVAKQPVCKNSEFQCVRGNGSQGNPICIPRSFQCDGYNDCPDRSDEIGCGKLNFKIQKVLILI